jgi:uncharacterized protein YbaA (DUF1428 family)
MVKALRLMDCWVNDSPYGRLKQLKLFYSKHTDSLTMGRLVGWVEQRETHHIIAQ